MGSWLNEASDRLTTIGDSGQQVLDTAAGYVGAEASGPIEDSENPVSVPFKISSGVIGWQEGIQQDLLGNEEASREAWVATGGARSAIDHVVDYEGEWGDQEDTEDLIGPSVDLMAATDDERNILDWRSRLSQENDPTSPENSWLVRWLMNNPEKAILAVIALYILTALGPVFDLAANATE